MPDHPTVFLGLENTGCVDVLSVKHAKRPEAVLNSLSRFNTWGGRGVAVRPWPIDEGDFDRRIPGSINTGIESHGCAVMVITEDGGITQFTGVSEFTHWEALSDVPGWLSFVCRLQVELAEFLGPRRKRSVYEVFRRDHLKMLWNKGGAVIKRTSVDYESPSPDDIEALEPVLSPIPAQQVKLSVQILDVELLQTYLELMAEDQKSMVERVNAILDAEGTAGGGGGGGGSKGTAEYCRLLWRGTLDEQAAAVAYEISKLLSF